MRKLLLLVTAILTLVSTSCSSKVVYMEPRQYKGADGTSVELRFYEDKKTIWKRIHKALDDTEFKVIESDKETGVIYVGYSGSPVKYVDCGMIKSTVSTPDAITNYEFPAASGHQVYEIESTTHKGIVFKAEREMTLDARTQLIVFKLGNSLTKVVITTKYVITRTLDLQNKKTSAHYVLVDAGSFDTNKSCRLSTGKGQRGTQCKATGAFEERLIQLIKNYE